MDKSKELFPELGIARLRNTCLLLDLLLLKETVNLNRFKHHVGALLGNVDTRADSHYKRLTRYFNDLYNQRVLWKLLLWYACSRLTAALDRRGGGRYLLMDATCWEFGSVRFQFLTLSVLFYGVAIPICWLELGKKGNSNLSERKALIRMAATFCDLRGATLLADREYRGREWFEWLEGQGLYFTIRLPHGCYRRGLLGKMAYSRLCRLAKRGRKVECPVRVGRSVYRLLATADKSDGNGLLLVLTNRQRGSTTKVLETYRLRWKIEAMFFHFKSNGFDVEALGLTDPRKVRLMMALIVVAYVLCVCTGIRKLGKIRKQAGRFGGHPYESVFRKGYGMLAPLFPHIALFLDFVLKDLTRSKIRPAPP